MSVVSPINAHQHAASPSTKGSVALLRRPRAPKLKLPAPDTTTSTNGISLRSRDTSSQGPAPSRGRRPAHPPDASYPHPTPLTPHHASTLPSRNQCSEYPESCDSESTITVHSLYPRGPSFLPPGKILKATHPPLSLLYGEHPELVPSEPEWAGEGGFSLNDFQAAAGVLHKVETSQLKGAAISRQNYLKLTSWFSTQVPRQEAMNTVTVTVDHDHPGDRRPRHQLMIELRAMIQEMIEASGNSVARPEGEEGTPTASSVSLDAPRWPTPSPGDIIFQGSTSRYFCGEGRSDSPFNASHQPLISPAEVAILESMMEGGARLSLKAHFLSRLPSLSPLTSTLTYLNLSFNDLRVFPAEVLQLQELVCLKMRNNPVKDIPSEIRKLRKLEIFCASFNLLNDLPSGLFELVSLVELDVSHNVLQWLSRDIHKLRNLRKLNVEGNQLAGLPSTSLSLPLTALLVTDNFFHPLLWQENTRNQPQALADLCCIVVSRCVDDPSDPRLPAQARETLQSHAHSGCDGCGGRVFGCGLRLIRAVGPEQWGVKNLPFIFSVCSPSCRVKLRCSSLSDWTRDGT